MSGNDKDPFAGLDDDLSGSFGVPTQAKAVTPPEHFKPRTFTETCPKCGGTGRFRNIGPCFACKGQGSHTFKTSPGQRAQARAKAEDRRDRERAELAETAKAWMDGHKAETEWLIQAAARNERRGGTFDFPAKLLEAIGKFGGLTEGQLSKVRELALRDANRAAEREAAKPVVDAGKLEEAFAIAKEKATRRGQLGVWIKPLPLTSELDPKNRITVIFQPGSTGSAFEGMIFAKTSGGKKLGHIKGGKFSRKFECSDAEAAAVLDCCQDPFKAAKAFGKAWSKCCVCGQQLTNDESIAAGIGPICRGKFGW